MPPFDDIRVGDLVNVPGGMYGIVKYLGAVEGKPGRFAGIELAPEHSSRGKNNGDVDGRSYFASSIPGAGIFVPMNSSKYVTRRPVIAPPTPLSQGAINNFSKSVGPPSVPKARLRRPSLPRAESPRAPLPPKLNLSGLRSPSSSVRTISSANGIPRSPLKTPSRFLDRPSSRVSLDDETPLPQRSSDFRPLGGVEVQELREKVHSLEAELRNRDKQLEEQAVTLEELQRSITELEGMDALSVRAQLREKNEKIAQLTAEFDSHRADFRSTLDALEVAASETERVYERKLDELMQQNRELQDRGEDVETVARQLKQLEELVSELEEGLEDARRGEAEARGEVEFLRGEVERTRLELKQEREKSTAALKDAESRRSMRELEQKEDEIRGLKAIIHSLSREDVNPSLLQSGRSATAGKADQDSAEPERLIQLEQRIKELEALAEHRYHRIEELQHASNPGYVNGTGRTRERSGTVTVAPLRQLKASRNSTGTRSTTKRPISHIHTPSDRTIVPSGWQESTATEELSPSFPSRHDITDGESNYPTDSGRDSDHPSSDEGNAPWCEICEISGHDILTCTNMFGNNSGSTNADTSGATNQEANGSSADNYLTFAGSSNHDLPPKRTSNGLKLYSESPTSQRTGRDVVLEGLKNIGGLSPSMSPAAGKASGVINESKWCALCERDGHESIDCPFED